MWFKTGFLVEYSSLLGLKKLLKINDYLYYKKLHKEVEYLSYLTIKHKNFFVGLITCPYCLNVFIALISCVFYGNINLFFIIYMLSILIFKLLEIYVWG